MQAALLGRLEPIPSCSRPAVPSMTSTKRIVFVARQLAGFPFEFHARLDQIPRQACSEKMQICRARPELQG